MSMAFCSCPSASLVPYTPPSACHVAVGTALRCKFGFSQLSVQNANGSTATDSSVSRRCDSAKSSEARIRWLRSHSPPKFDGLFRRASGSVPSPTPAAALEGSDDQSRKQRHENRNMPEKRAWMSRALSESWSSKCAVLR